MNKHEKINYLEIPAKDLVKTKDFFTSTFGFTFIDYGPTYTAFDNAGIDGGFFQSDLTSTTSNGSCLIVLYSDDLESSLSKVTQFQGKIIKEIFSFPGGRRFHFEDPNGNEFAVWGN